MADLTALPQLDAAVTNLAAASNQSKDAVLGVCMLMVLAPFLKEIHQATQQQAPVQPQMQPPQGYPQQPYGQMMPHPASADAHPYNMQPQGYPPQGYAQPPYPPQGYPQQPYPYPPQPMNQPYGYPPQQPPYQQPVGQPMPPQQPQVPTPAPSAAMIPQINTTEKPAEIHGSWHLYKRLDRSSNTVKLVVPLRSEQIYFTREKAMSEAKPMRKVRSKYFYVPEQVPLVFVGINLKPGTNLAKEGTEAIKSSLDFAQEMDEASREIGISKEQPQGRT